MDNVVRPDISDEQLASVSRFLAELRESGAVNMMGAREDIQYWWEGEYGEKLSRSKAREILMYWMKTFRG